MQGEIHVVASQQRYVSDELTHFVGKGMDPSAQYALLLKIIKSGWLTHPPHKPMMSGGTGIHQGRKLSENEMYSPNVVCFCDIPVADMALHVGKYSPFGLSFSKGFIAANGGSPVHYVSKSSRVKVEKDVKDQLALMDVLSLGMRLGVNVMIDSTPEDMPAALYNDVERGQYFDKMVNEFHEILGPLFTRLYEMPAEGNPLERNLRIGALHHFVTEQLFAYLKFFDHTLPDDHPENYYLEREWRIVGNLKFNIEDIRRVFMPKEYAERFRADCPKYCGQLTFVEQPDAGTI